MTLLLSFQMYEVSIELKNVLVNFMNYFNMITSKLDFKLIIQTSILVALILNIIIFITREKPVALVAAIDQQQLLNNRRTVGAAAVVIHHQHIIQVQQHQQHAVIAPVGSQQHQQLQQQQQQQAEVVAFVAAHHAAFATANPTVNQQKYRARVWAWRTLKMQSRDVNDSTMANISF